MMRLKYPGEASVSKGLKLLAKLICIMLVSEPRMRGNMTEEERLEEYWWHFNSKLITTDLQEKLIDVQKVAVTESSLKVVSFIMES